jgi:hypothetical protein
VRVGAWVPLGKQLKGFRSVAGKRRGPTELAGGVHRPKLKGPSTIQVSDFKEKAVPTGPEAHTDFQVVGHRKVPALAGGNQLAVHPKLVGVVGPQEQ